MRTSEIGLFLVLWVLTGCDIIEPLDNMKPEYKLTEENVYTDEAKVEANLRGMYALWRSSAMAYMPGNLWALAGNYESSTSDGNRYNSNNVNADNADLESYYRSMYAIIQEASFLIDNLSVAESIPGLSKERQLEIEAEARCARAMAHFFLLEVFGQFYDLASSYGIVIIKEASREVIAQGRQSVDESYKAILNDFDFAIDFAPAINVHYKFSNTVARAFKAKVLLYRRQYAESAHLAAEVIADLNYGLEDSYANIFEKGYHSKEVLFAPFVTGKEWSFTTESYFSPSGIIAIAEDDKRYQFAHVEGANIGLVNQKYMHQSPLLEEQGNTYVRLRMAEVYLIYAEAKTRMAASINDMHASEAIDKLNTIRFRADMPLVYPQSREELLKAIRYEKNLELFGEYGQPWFDMVRYHKLGDVNISEIKQAIKNDYQLILPIPRNAMVGNAGLVQNPGY